MVDLVFGLDVVMPNQAYERIIGKPYATLHILPNNPNAATLGSQGQDVHTGTLQVSLNYPKSKTDGPLLRAGDVIEQEYQKYIRQQRLVSGGIKIKITSVGVGAASSDDAWYFAPVNINYQTYIQGIS